MSLAQSMLAEFEEQAPVTCRGEPQGHEQDSLIQGFKRLESRRLYDDSNVQCCGNTHREDLRHQ